MPRHHSDVATEKQECSKCNRKQSFKRGRNLYPNRSTCQGSELATFKKSRVRNDVATTHSGSDLKKS